MDTHDLLAQPDNRDVLAVASHRTEELDEQLAQQGWQLVLAALHNGNESVVCRCNQGHEDHYLAAHLEAAEPKCHACAVEHQFYAARIRRAMQGWIAVTSYLTKHCERVSYRCNNCQYQHDVPVEQFLGEDALGCTECLFGTPRVRSLAEGRLWTHLLRFRAEAQGWSMISRLVWGGRIDVEMKCPDGHEQQQRVARVIEGGIECRHCDMTPCGPLSGKVHDKVERRDAWLFDYANPHSKQKRILTGHPGPGDTRPSPKREAKLQKVGHRIVGRHFVGHRQCDFLCECPSGHVSIRSDVCIDKQPDHCSTCKGEKRLTRLAKKAATRDWVCVTDAPIVSTKQELMLRCKCGKTQTGPFNQIYTRLIYCECRRAGKPLQRIADYIAGKGGSCLTTTGVSSVADMVKVRCEKGHVWKSTGSNLLKGHWCGKCHFAARRTSIEDARALASKNGGKCLSRSVPSSLTPLNWACGKGHRFSRPYTYFALVSKFCPVCTEGSPPRAKAQKNRRKVYLAKCREAAIERGGTCLSPTYENAHTKLEWRCGVGHRWWTRPANILYNGSWCPACAKEAKFVNKAGRRTTSMSQC